MNDENNDMTEASPTRYRIGAVSRITGISPETLRMWERRYSAVTPNRSQGGGRLYGQADVARLVLIKRLVDAGDAIGTVANLDHAELESRFERLSGTTVQTANNHVVSLAVCGSMLIRQCQEILADNPRIELVGVETDIERLAAAVSDEGCDVLAIEWPNLLMDDLSRLWSWREKLNASRIIVIYTFAPQPVLNALAEMGVVLLRAPIDTQELVLACSVAVGDSPAAMRRNIMEEIPSRRFSDEELSKLAGMSNALRCECPRHVSQLLHNLLAFEKYSANCASQSINDSVLHAQLQVSTAQARSIMEEALMRLVETEGLLDKPD